ncbi:MAG TPA: bacillithiol transferase BstA [Candidatus Acidoferrales bacterium]|nr:bacillithiol transferase BstA [Candidatus Acidoferrales bacterium]
METDLRYPIGKLQRTENLSDAQRTPLISAIAEAPAKLRQAVAGLTEQQLDTPYRPGGWTVRQVVHHLPDSHMNSVVRFKLALTEDEPTIKPYDEALWAKLPDAKGAVEPSLVLLESLHTRWITLLDSLSPSDWKRTVRHPEMGIVSLDGLLQMYAWHGRHHVAHITSLRERNGWR